MNLVRVCFLSWLERVWACVQILRRGWVPVPAAQLTYASPPSVKELCTVLVAVMGAPNTSEDMRRLVASTLTAIAFPDPKPSSGFLRTRGN